MRKIIILSLVICVLLSIGVSAAVRNVPGTYSTIQVAVNAANPGDTVVVGPGTYTEQVVVTKSITLQGSGATIQAPATGDIVTIGGSPSASVEISGFTITGPVSVCGRMSGIYVRDGAYANIHDNIIKDIRQEPITGCQRFTGILVGYQTEGTTGRADITDNTVLRSGKTNIVIDNTGSNANVVDNVVIGSGPLGQPYAAENGVQITRGATGTVVGNTISDLEYTGPTYTASGILIGGTSGIVVTDNTVIRVQSPIYDQFSSNNIVKYNEFSGTSSFSSGIYVGDSNLYEKNCFDRNQGSFAWVYFDGYYGSGSTLINNNFYGNPYSLWAYSNVGTVFSGNYYAATTLTDAILNPSPIENICGPDIDDDGVLNYKDICPGTVIPESVPTERLDPNHYAMVDGDNIFEAAQQIRKRGDDNEDCDDDECRTRIVDSQYTTTDTCGCSCEQILDAKPGKNEGEYEQGCSKGTIKKWIKNGCTWSEDDDDHEDDNEIKDDDDDNRRGPFGKAKKK